MCLAAQIFLFIPREWCVVNTLLLKMTEVI